MLYLLKQYSPSELKYDKKIKIQTDKQDYIYHISDIHYEIDMSLLGCNSKLVWHELFMQIVDIISVKQDKIGIICCKNFHSIHNELLDIFYSYIQQYSSPHSNIQIRFIIVTEHISFIPNNILNACKRIQMGRPNKESYMRMVSSNPDQLEKYKQFISRISNTKKNPKFGNDVAKVRNLVEIIQTQNITNTKEVKSLSLIKSAQDIPKDVFNTVCDNLIRSIENYEKLEFTEFRDVLYDILIYNLDVIECLWYVILHFIRNGKISDTNLYNILKKSYEFLKLYNNNYRPIYHLESIFFYIISSIHNVSI
jgi:hypothetical protein